jgi:hypothetical protein
MAGAEIRRSIAWPTTRIQTKNNPVKRNLGSSITIPAICPERPSVPAKKSLGSNPIWIRLIGVMSDKKKTRRQLMSNVAYYLVVQS